MPKILLFLVSIVSSVMFADFQKVPDEIIIWKRNLFGLREGAGAGKEKFYLFTEKKIHCIVKEREGSRIWEHECHKDYQTIVKGHGIIFTVITKNRKQYLRALLQENGMVIEEFESPLKKGFIPIYNEDTRNQGHLLFVSRENDKDTLHLIKYSKGMQTFIEDEHRKFSLENTTFASIPIFLKQSDQENLDRAKILCITQNENNAHYSLIKLSYPSLKRDNDFSPIKFPKKNDSRISIAPFVHGNTKKFTVVYWQADSAGITFYRCYQRKIQKIGFLLGEMKTRPYKTKKNLWVFSSINEKETLIMIYPEGEESSFYFLENKINTHIIGGITNYEDKERLLGFGSDGLKYYIFGEKIDSLAPFFHKSNKRLYSSKGVIGVTVGIPRRSPIVFNNREVLLQAEKDNIINNYLYDLENEEARLVWSKEMPENARILGTYIQKRERNTTKLSLFYLGTKKVYWRNPNHGLRDFEIKLIDSPFNTLAIFAIDSNNLLTVGNKIERVTRGGDSKQLENFIFEQEKIRKYCFAKKYSKLAIATKAKNIYIFDVDVENLRQRCSTKRLNEVPRHLALMEGSFEELLLIVGKRKLFQLYEIPYHSTNLKALEPKDIKWDKRFTSKGLQGPIHHIENEIYLTYRDKTISGILVHGYIKYKQEFPGKLLKLDKKYLLVKEDKCITYFKKENNKYIKKVKIENDFTPSHGHYSEFEGKKRIYLAGKRQINYWDIENGKPYKKLPTKDLPATITSFFVADNDLYISCDNGDIFRIDGKKELSLREDQ